MQKKAIKLSILFIVIAILSAVFIFSVSIKKKSIPTESETKEIVTYFQKEYPETSEYLKSNEMNIHWKKEANELKGEIKLDKKNKIILIDKGSSFIIKPDGKFASELLKSK